MMISINVKPMVGEIAYAFSSPFIDDSGVPYIRHVMGSIVKSRNNETEFRIHDVDDWFPIYRIKQYTFGGVMVDNELFDERRCSREDKKLLKRLGVIK